MTNQGNIADDVWAEALYWGRLTGTQENDLLEALVTRALRAPQAIPVQPAAAWMRKAKRIRTGGPRIAVAVLNGRNWNELDDRLRAFEGAEQLHGPTPRSWYVLPYAALDAIQTLFSDFPDRVRICMIDSHTP